MNAPKVYAFDVVVIGAGGAGLRAAVEASRRGARTALICKSLLGKAHTVMAEGGAAAALRNQDQRDNWQVHFRDTMRGAKFLCDWRMARIHAQQSPDRIRELEQWGAVFDRTPQGWIAQRNFGGHAYPRLAHVGDRTGLELIRTLQDKGVHSGIEVYQENTVIELFTAEGRVTGCLAYDRKEGHYHLFHAKSIVLATGGIGKLYDITSNSWEYTADGIGLAYRAGAELMNMEFIQFHPTGMLWPPSVAGVLVTEGVRGEGGVLRNSEGKRFMFGYIPEMFREETADSEEEAQRWLAGDKEARRPPELLTRDVVARAIRSEVLAGRGSPRGGAFLDISWREPAYVLAKLPSMHHQFMKLANLDITKEPMEVGPTMHYHMGGIRVDAETQMTAVGGLFAAGECATGLHGANRLGGNSLTDLLVFGKLAGEHAAAWADVHGQGPVSEDAIRTIQDLAEAPLTREVGENPFKVHADLRALMQSHAGMVRTQEELATGLEKLKAFGPRIAALAAPGVRKYNAGWHTIIDLRNLVIAAEAVMRSAAMRQESRGGHTREDFPETDKTHWARFTLVAKAAGAEMQVVETPLPEAPPEVKAIYEAELLEVSTKEVSR